MQEIGGDLLVWFVAAIALGAMCLVLSIADVGAKRDKSTKNIDSSAASINKKSSKNSTSVNALLADSPIAMRDSMLIVPPPDEARIEAVAPKNHSRWRM